MNVQLDLKAIERLITRHCKGALSELGFDTDDDAPRVEVSFAWNEDNDCIGIDISQVEQEKPKQKKKESPMPPARGRVQ